MRRILLPILTLLLCAGAYSQSFDYGNGWYNPANRYYKILTWQEGIYRITLNDLLTAGLDTTGLRPANIHLIYRGKEQPLYVTSSGPLLDFMEFYGRRNDGRDDSVMFKRNQDPSRYLHDPDGNADIEVSLFTDTACYYIYWDAVPGLRYTNYSNTAYSSFTPEPSFRFLSRASFLDFSYWYKGSENQTSISYPTDEYMNCDYVPSEGYPGSVQYGSSGSGFTLNTPGYVSGFNANTFTVRLHSAKNTFSSKRGGFLLGIDSILSYRVPFTTSNNFFTRTFDTTFVRNIPASSFFTCASGDIMDAYNYVHWASLEYDHDLDLRGTSEILVYRHLRPLDTYLAFYGGVSHTSCVAYDLLNKVRIQGTAAADSMKFIIPGSGAERRLYVAGSGAIRTPLISTNVHLVNLSSLTNTANHIIIAHRSLSASALAMENYRDTCTINPMTSRVVYTDEIYDEFGHGMITPWAIKRFIQYAVNEYNIPAEYILLWGYGHYDLRNHPEQLVPTIGYPPSDIYYAFNDDPNKVDSLLHVSIGRLVAFSNADGFAYVNKVNEYEHEEWAPYMKNAYFMTGGKGTSEQNLLWSNAIPWMQEVRDTVFSGNVFYARNVDSIAPRTNTPLTTTQLINNGLHLIQVYAHSSSEYTELNLNAANGYQNFGKYPIILVFGCYAGDFTNPDALSVSYPKEPNRGAIAYIANSAPGYPGQLTLIGNHWYDMTFDGTGNRRLGDLVTMSYNSFNSTFYPLNTNFNKTIRNHIQHTNLQGDPGLMPHFPQKTDYEITEADIYFEPGMLSSALDSFTVNVIIHNNGRYPQDTTKFRLSVRQKLPSGTWVDYPSVLVPPIALIDTIPVKIYNTFGSAMTGLDVFDIFVDSTLLVDEYREDNNRLVNFPIIFPGNSPATIYPWKYAVIDTANSYLAASQFVITPTNLDFLFEIDTTPDFNSPFKVNSPVINAPSHYARWDIPFTLIDSVEYWWRVRIATIYPEDWAVSTFQYIEGKTGWGQSEPEQFYEDEKNQVDLPTTTQVWEFDRVPRELFAYINPGSDGIFVMDPYATGYNARGLDGVLYNIFDRHSLKPQYEGTLIEDAAYQAPTGGNPSGLMSDISNMASGDYILIMGQQNPHHDEWNSAAFDFLEGNLGISSSLRSLPPGRQFLIWARKDGAPGTSIEVYSPNSGDSMMIYLKLYNSYNHGDVISTTVGPASGWDELIWHWNSQDLTVNENAQVDVFAIRTNNTDSLVFSNLTEGSWNLSAIDALRFPNLRLECRVWDSIYYTAPQLSEWYVMYNPAPDLAVNPNLAFIFNNDTTDEGQPVFVQMTAQNLYHSNFNDSVEVDWRLIRADRSVVDMGTTKVGPIPGDSSRIISYTFSPAVFSASGDLRLQVELNPDSIPAEQQYFNNFYNHPFLVVPDRYRPVVDVTFDGRHIMDGEIVSPSPEITIMLKDENQYLAVSDTALELYFGDGPFSMTRVPLTGNPVIERIPATLPENTARVIYRPVGLPDGEYILRVKGYDYRSNESGTGFYEIRFRVINESSITNVFNYPNPFSTSTRFVFTITGAEVPEVFQIHVYTISGKFVKLIDLKEMDDLHIGNNITSYAWDGTDEFGDKLANGLYLYRVFTRIGGKDVKLRDEETTGGYFDHGWGKMYIMR